MSGRTQTDCPILRLCSAAAKLRAKGVSLASIAINIVIAIGSVGAWLSIMLGTGDDRQLARHGWRSLKYYTVLSNLFSGAVSAAYVLCLLAGTPPTPVLLTLKLAAAAVVMVTFLVTAILLVPVYGAKSMYQGGNFWLHLVLPLLAAIDVCLFAPIETLPLWSTLAPVAFTALYAVGYLRPLLKYGAERDGQVYDFYGFLRWGKERIWLVAAAMLLLTWILALALYLI